MAKDERLSLKVWVDNAKKRAVFAETSSDFVDVLFSFLTLPLGTIVKLLSKNSGLGSIDNLYDSIENLGDQYWRTEACRTMLLSPCNAAGKHCEDLKLNVDGDANPREFYYCKKESCISRSECYFSSVRDTRCHCCGEVMNEVKMLEKVETGEIDGVFVKKNSAKYIITDDFHVKPCSVLYYYDILKEFGVEGIHRVKERTLEFGREELLNLLKNLLEGKGVLTKICFPDLCIQHSTTDEMKTKIFESKGNAQFETENLEIKLIMNRTNNTVVCVELGNRFANQLFSFLTFPLGSVLKLIGNSNSLGCMTNLYNSIQQLKIKRFKSENAKSELISPKLAPFFGYKKQMLNIQECSPYVGRSIRGCQKCTWDKINVPYMASCKHGVQYSDLNEINPKLLKTVIYSDRGFVRKAQDFLVTDDLHVTPLSFLSFTQIVEKLGLHDDHLEKREMTIGRTQVVDLLRAMLISKTALSAALFQCGK